MKKYTKALIIVWGSVIVILLLLLIISSIIEKNKIDSMSPEQRTIFLHEADRVRLEEQKKKDEKEKFEKTRYTYELLLKSFIRTSAYDPDSLIFGNTDYYSNGVCIHVNGKNRFGGYVGFKEYCAMMDKNGKWKIQQ